MKLTTPTKEEWKKLYDSAIRFKKTKCWDWMEEGDIFGVQDPETGEIAYCCIMGQGGEHYALGAYLGSEGLDGLLGMMTGGEDQPAIDWLFAQKCLMASFEDRDQLEAKDYKIIKDLGLSFRGKNAWPLFRDYTPGLFPWFITSAQCRFLTLVLEQAVEVSERCRLTKNILDTEDDYTFLTRVPARQTSGIIWHDEYLTAEPPQPKYISVELTNELGAKRIASRKSKQNAVWECDLFYLPSPIKERERPHYPRVFMLADATQGIILGFEMITDLANDGDRIIDLFMRNMEESRFKPAHILVSRDETYYFFKDIARQLSVELKKVPRLPILDEARQGLIENMP